MTRARNSTAMRGFIAAMISAISFSTLGIFAELLYSHGFSVLCVLAWRFLVAALFLWLVVYIREWFQSKDIPAEKDATKKIADHERGENISHASFCLVSLVSRHKLGSSSSPLKSWTPVLQAC